MRNDGVGDLDGVDMQDTVHEGVSRHSCSKHSTPFRNLRYDSQSFNWMARIVGFEQTIATWPQQVLHELSVKG